jgi:hypothetical protein
MKVVKQLVAGGLAGLLVCAAAIGCNKAPARAPMQEVPVNGMVTLDGKPLAGAEVVFTTPSLAMFTAATKEDGRSSCPARSAASRSAKASAK